MIGYVQNLARLIFRCLGMQNNAKLKNKEKDKEIEVK